MTKKDQEITAISNPKGYSSLKGDVDWLKRLMTAIIVVLFIGFAGMFVATGQMMIDSLRGKQQSYSELETKVKEQNDKIDALTKAIQDSR